MQEEAREHSPGAGEKERCELLEGFSFRDPEPHTGDVQHLTTVGIGVTRVDSERHFGVETCIREVGYHMAHELEAVDEIVPPTSALFVVIEAGNLDRLGDRVRMDHHKLIHTNLPGAERATLLETFGG